jgi:hypothetical protein
MNTYFSFYKRPISNITPYTKIAVSDAYRVIKGNYFKKQTLQLRQIADKAEASKFKRFNFHYVTFSGVFEKRHESALVRHSGLIVFDFDGVEDIPALRNLLISDSEFETALLFVSPSGNGIKWVVEIDLELGTHQQFYDGIKNYLEFTYSIKSLDKSGRDVARACFLPHDPEVYINPKYVEND